MTCENSLDLPRPRKEECHNPRQQLFALSHLPCSDANSGEDTWASGNQNFKGQRIM
jgi:hypothetical protein